MAFMLISSGAFTVLQLGMQEKLAVRNCGQFFNVLVLAALGDGIFE
ncbi:hypothetical protein J2T13_005332 [Paenibacillus sp. DS2015]